MYTVHQSYIHQINNCTINNNGIFFISIDDLLFIKTINDLDISRSILHINRKIKLLNHISTDFNIIDKTVM